MLLEIHYFFYFYEDKISLKFEGKKLEEEMY